MFWKAYECSLSKSNLAQVNSSTVRGFRLLAEKFQAPVGKAKSSWIGDRRLSSSMDLVAEGCLDAVSSTLCEGLVGVHVLQACRLRLLRC